MLRSRKKPFSLTFWVAIAVVTIFSLAEAVSRHEETKGLSASRLGFAFQSYGFASSGRSVPYRDLSRSGDLIEASYGFRNFDSVNLQINYETSALKLKSYRRHYGYPKEKLDALYAWQKKALEDAYHDAVRQKQSQRQLDQKSAQIQDQYRRKMSSLIRGSGFKYLSSDALAPDMSYIVRKNIRNMRPVAMEIDRIVARQGYDSHEAIGVALSLMQAGLAYENVPLEVDDWVIGGIYPPMVAMAEGRGDCDSKTAVMAAIPLNWDQTRVLGVGVPGHYLIGVLQHPAKGDVYVEYEGLKYVLMEPAGPGRLLPGKVSHHTLNVLDLGDQVNLEALRRY
jgi:hypothetical protein